MTPLLTTPTVRHGAAVRLSPPFLEPYSWPAPHRDGLRRGRQEGRSPAARPRSQPSTCIPTAPLDAPQSPPSPSTLPTHTTTPPSPTSLPNPLACPLPGQPRWTTPRSRPASLTHAPRAHTRSPVAAPPTSLGPRSADPPSPRTHGHLAPPLARPPRRRPRSATLRPPAPSPLSSHRADTTGFQPFRSRGLASPATRPPPHASSR